jgi:type IV pilus assembly protein PilA
MNKFMRKLWAKKKSEKGFTLVELIVVLVILAILAAIMVPSLIGWIDKAREKQVILEARNAYLAAQSIVQEAYAADKTIKEAADLATNDNIKEIAKYTDGESQTIAEADIDSDYVITKFVYKCKANTGSGATGDKYTATYEDGVWEIE